MAIPRGNWGYAIFRTDYTPESHTLWDPCLRKLTSYIHRSIFTSVRTRPLHTHPFQLPSITPYLPPPPGLTYHPLPTTTHPHLTSYPAALVSYPPAPLTNGNVSHAHLPHPHPSQVFDWTLYTPETGMYSSMIFNNEAQYDGMGIEETTSTFLMWLEDTPETQRQGINEHIFLLIDIEVLRWLRDAPGPGWPNHPPDDALDACYVKVVDADWEGNRRDGGGSGTGEDGGVNGNGNGNGDEDGNELIEVDSRYEGWGLVPANALMDIWRDVNREVYTFGQMVSASVVLDEEGRFVL